MTTYDSKDLKIARLVVSKVKGDFSLMDMHYLIAERGNPVSHFIDKHIMRLSKNTDILRMMQQQGLNVSFMKTKMFTRGLLVGVKPNA